MTKPDVVITCSECGHKALLTMSEFKGFLEKLSIQISTLSKETLMNVARRLKCSNCEAKAASITRQPASEEGKADAQRREHICKVCQKAFPAPRFVLRSKIGICPKCQEVQDEKLARNRQGSANASPKVRSIGRYMDNLPPGGRTKQTVINREKPISNYDIPEYEEGTPRPGWANNSDWKKMRSGQYSDMKKRQRDG
jgi:hypothetical protein